MDPFADPDDVTAISGPLNNDQTAALEGLISQASTKLRGWGLDRGVDIDSIIADDELKAEIVRQAVANAVKRAVLMLEGFNEVTFAIDDYRETHRRGSGSTSDVFIDVSDLLGLLPRRASGFGTLRLGRAL